MLRLGSPGLERMLPSPESGLRCSMDSAMASVDRARLGRPGGRHARRVDGAAEGAGSSLSRSSGSETCTGSSGVMPERARNMHFTTGAAPRSRSRPSLDRTRR